MSVAAQDVQFAIGLPPEAALAHLAAKGAQVTGAWREWLDGQHARAFTVANVAKLDVLQDIQASLDAALKKGQTLSQWQAGLIPELQRKGWWQREGSTAQLQAAGRVSGQGVIAKGLTPHRLKTIFQTNMQSAYMAGRFGEMMEQAQERPYWQYVAILDGKTRPAHRALNGKTFRYDDKGWDAFFPPNGFNCRCRTRNFSERDVSSRGISVGSTEGKLRQVNVPLKGGGSAQVLRYSDASLPGGKFQPDAGFSNNPAQLAHLVEAKLAAAPAALGAQAAQALSSKAKVSRVLTKEFSQGLAAVMADPIARGRRLTIGYLGTEEIDHMAALKRSPSSAAVQIEDRLIVGKKSIRHQAADDALTPEQWASLPSLFTDERTVVLRQVSDNRLIYLLPSTQASALRLAVHVDWTVKGQQMTNMVRSAQQLSLIDATNSVSRGDWILIRGVLK